MEIKFIKYIPRWAIYLIHRNNIVREKMSKFVSGIEKLDPKYQVSLQKKIFSVIDQMIFFTYDFQLSKQIDFYLIRSS